MKIKLNKKMIIVSFIIFFITIIISNVCFAASPFGKGAVQNFMKTSQNEYNSMAEDENSQVPLIGKVVSGIIYFVQMGGMALAVIFLIVLGIKYMASSVNERAQIKQHMVTYMFGIVILFAASGLLGLIRNTVVGIVYDNNGNLR